MSIGKYGVYGVTMKWDTRSSEMNGCSINKMFQQGS